MILPVSIVLFVKDIGPKGLKLWMQRRVSDGPLNGLMEFPGGKIEAGESSEEAGRREVHEEVGVEVKEYLPLFKRHSYVSGDKTILLHVHFSRFEKIPSSKGEWFEFQFGESSQHLEGQIPKVNHEFIDLFLEYIEKQNSGNHVERLWQKC
ncbi:MAG: mutator protein MutT [Bacteriovoracaceae bacterium]|jgi:mutator protein MutT